MKRQTGTSDLVPGRLVLVGSREKVPAARGEFVARVSRPFDDVMGSAVMPSAKAIIDPNWVLDELELRLTRCVLPASATSSSLRIGSVLPAGEALHRIASWETRSWWTDQGLSEVDDQVQRSIFEAMLMRSPLYFGWAAVPLALVLAEDLVDSDMVMNVVEWVTSSGPVQRVVRDAIALGLVVPWLLARDASTATLVITRLCHGQQPERIRMGLMVAAAYVRASNQMGTAQERLMLDSCWTHASRVDAETAMALGWVLKELIKRQPERVLPEVLARVHELSRQAMRTAVEGLPVEIRRLVTSKWLERLRRRSLGLITTEPQSVARPRRQR